MPDNQAATKGILSQKVTSRLVRDCIEELKILTELNRVKVVWVPGHQEVETNEEAEELEKRGSKEISETDTKKYISRFHK